MKFEQAIVGETLRFFKKNFMDRWGFSEYHDINKPLVILGYHSNKQILNTHKGWKLLIPGTPEDIPDFSTLKGLSKIIIQTKNNNLIPNNVICKKAVIEIKDYSIFTPNILGDKIYLYSGFQNGWNLKNPLVNEIQKQINYEIITTSHQNIKDYHDVSYLKSEFYDKCFINLNLTNGNGMTTVRELGLMGRKTITMRNNVIYDYPCIINCSSIKEIIDVINKEAQKINTIQPSINSHTVGSEWLDLDWWIN